MHDRHRQDARRKRRRRPAGLTKGNGLIWPADAPIKAYADIAVCFGNLAPGGDGLQGQQHERAAVPRHGRSASTTRRLIVRRRDCEVGFAPGSVIVLRYLGPVAAGMPEVFVATAALCTRELDGRVAFLSDTRVSGVSHGAIGVHCCPEAAVGGPIALVADGDRISFDLLVGDITLHVPADELAARKANWRPPALLHDAATSPPSRPRLGRRVPAVFPYGENHGSGRTNQPRSRQGPYSLRVRCGLRHCTSGGSSNSFRRAFFSARVRCGLRHCTSGGSSNSFRRAFFSAEAPCVLP